MVFFFLFWRCLILIVVSPKLNPGIRRKRGEELRWTAVTALRAVSGSGANKRKPTNYFFFCVLCLLCVVFVVIVMFLALPRLGGVSRQTGSAIAERPRKSSPKKGLMGRGKEAFFFVFVFAPLQFNFCLYTRSCCFLWKCTG